MDKLPNKFEFKGAGKHNFIAELTGGTYAVTSKNGFYVSEHLHPSYIKRQINEGVYTFVKDLDEPKAKPKLVLPFTFLVEGDEEGTLYTASTTQESGRIRISWLSDYEGGYTTYPQVSVEEYVIDGSWIVKSVGEQKAPEASVRPDKETCKLTLKIETEEALEHVKELTEAMNNLADAYERVILAKERMYV